MARHTSTQGDLHPMDLHEQRAVKRPTPGQTDRVAGMDAKMIQPPLQTQASSDSKDACALPRSDLVECHG